MKPLKIRWINPVGDSGFDQPVADLLRSVKRPETELEVVSLANDFPMAHLEYQTYEGFVVNGVLRVVRDAAEKDYDGVVIGCFYDTGLCESREISGDMVVVAPCQSSLQIVSNLANSFSIIIGRDKWVFRMKSNVRKYGFENSLASFRSVGMGVEEFQNDPKVTAEALTLQAEKAVKEDGAEAIILGCTIEFGFYEELQERLGVPVIDVVLSSFKMCEFSAGLKQQFGWKPSRVHTCEPPSESELQKWGLFGGPVPIGNTVEIG